MAVIMIITVIVSVMQIGMIIVAIIAHEYIQIIKFLGTVGVIKYIIIGRCSRIIIWDYFLIVIVSLRFTLAVN